MTRISDPSGPFAELSRLQNELNRVFSALLEGPDRTAGFLGQWDPAIDILDTEEAIRVVLELPGVPLEELRVRCRGDRVTVSGKKEPRSAAGEILRFHCMERTFGPFKKSISLPYSINTHKGSATYHEGILTIEFPKVPDLRQREIEVPITRPADHAAPRPRSSRQKPERK